MATASSEMTLKLVSDLSAVNKILADIDKFIEEVDDSPSKGDFTKLKDVCEKITPQVAKFGKGLTEKPPVFPPEDDYKKRRADVTALATAVAKVAKAVAKEKEAIKDEVTVKAYSSAKSELTGKHKGLAQALTMVARGEKGRSGPKVDGVKEYNHIHIGGDAQHNLLFQVGSRVVLGTLEFHLEKGLDDGKKKQIEKVAKRSGATVLLKVGADNNVSVK